MHRALLAAALLLAVAVPSAAEEAKGIITHGNDSYLAGRDVVFDRAGTEDLFAAGEIVRGQADIGGSAHLAGRRVTMTGAVGGDAYLAGMDLALEGPVAGDATLAGYNVSVTGVGGNLRMSGGNLSIGGPVSGYALIAGETVRIGGEIAGDAIITASDLTFAENARIGGQLTLFEEAPGALEIPANVVPEERIVRRDVSEWEDAAKGVELWNWQALLGRFLTGVLVVSALATLIAAVIPQTLAELRRGLLERPFRNLLFGFLTQSVFAGAAIILLMTVIGIIASPAAILAVVIAGFAGYIVAVYAFGVGLLLAIGRPAPTSIGTRALAAGLGAATVGIIALVPFLGWLFFLVLMLAGVGAITLKALRPAFFVAA